jgi:hypothetical protein
MILLIMNQNVVKYRWIIVAILCYLESKQFEQLVVKNNFAEDFKFEKCLLRYQKLQVVYFLFYNPL